MHCSKVQTSQCACCTCWTSFWETGSPNILGSRCCHSGIKACLFALHLSVISQTVWLQVSDHVPLCCAATTTGTKQWICPAAQPCACPTTQTGLNPFSCYDPTAYSCSDAAPNWPKSGLISGVGMSDQGACPSTCKLSLHPCTVS